MAQRPPSRGLMNKFRGNGQPITGANVPGVRTMRPGTVGINRPGTTARPGSSYKRVPTPLGAPPPSEGPVGLTTDLKVEARPVTSHGIVGAPAVQGPGRQVADRSYYIQEVRRKIRDITTEINSLKKEETTINKNADIYQKLERKYEETVSEVRELEGQLADFNLALDKLRTNTDMGEIEELYQNLKERNDMERKHVDEVFMKRSAGDKFTQELESELKAIHEEAAQKLSRMGDSLQDEYAQLQERSRTLTEEVEDKETMLLEIENRIRSTRQKLDSDEYKTHSLGIDLSKKLADLKRKKEEVVEDTNLAKSPEQMRDRLLQKVKEHNQDIKVAEGRIKELEDLIDTYQDDMRAKEQQLEEAKKHAAKAKKYEALYERERKMQQFIDRFPKTKAAEEANKTKLKQTIVAILEHISKGINMSQNLPSNEKLSELKEELTFKEQKMQQSKETLSHLRKERDKRKEELNKINSLDQKITRDISTLQKAINNMEKEMGGFKSPEVLRQETEAITERLRVENAVAKEKRDAMKQQVQILGRSFDQEKKKIASDPSVPKLEQVQQKLRTYGQTVFELSDYIKSRNRESDFQTLANEARLLVQEINQINIAGASQ